MERKNSVIQNKNKKIITKKCPNKNSEEIQINLQLNESVSDMISSNVNTNEDIIIENEYCINSLDINVSNIEGISQTKIIQDKTPERKYFRTCIEALSQQNIEDNWYRHQEFAQNINFTYDVELLKIVVEFQFFFEL